MRVVGAVRRFAETLCHAASTLVLENVTMVYVELARSRSWHAAIAENTKKLYFAAIKMTKRRASEMLLMKKVRQSMNNGQASLNVPIHVVATLIVESINVRNRVILRSGKLNIALDHQTLFPTVRVEKPNWEKYLTSLVKTARTPFPIVRKHA